MRMSASNTRGIPALSRCTSAFRSSTRFPSCRLLTPALDVSAPSVTRKLTTFAQVRLSHNRPTCDNPVQPRAVNERHDLLPQHRDAGRPLCVRIVGVCLDVPGAFKLAHYPACAWFQCECHDPRLRVLQLHLRRRLYTYACPFSRIYKAPSESSHSLHCRTYLLHHQSGLKLTAEHHESPAGCMLHLHTLPAGLLVVHQHLPKRAICTANVPRVSLPSSSAALHTKAFTKCRAGSRANCEVSTYHQHMHAFTFDVAKHAGIIWVCDDAKCRVCVCGSSKQVGRDVRQYIRQQMRRLIQRQNHVLVRRRGGAQRECSFASSLILRCGGARTCRQPDSNRHAAQVSISGLRDMDALRHGNVRFRHATVHYCSCVQCPR